MTGSSDTSPLAPLVDAIGTTLLDVVCGDLTSARPVAGITIHDPHDGAARHDRAVVLGVGVVGPVDTRELVRLALAAGASAVVLRDDTALTDDLRARAAEADLVLLRISPGVPWNQLAVSLSTALERETARRPRWSAPGRVDRERSLSDLANALATTLDAPVTVEDLNSRVLGYSDNQTRGDSSRHETILGRGVPARYTEMLRRHGVFERLYATDEPVSVDLTMLPDLDVPRIAIRIARGQYVVGSIWVATATPVAEVDVSVLRAAAVRAGELIDSGTQDQDRRRRSVAALVGDDETEAARSARELDLDGDPVQLLVVELVRPVGGGPELSSRDIDKYADVLHLQLAGVSSRAIAAAVGSQVVGVLPVDAVDAGPRRALAAAERFARTPNAGAPVHVVVVSAGRGAAGVRTAWADAAKAHAVLARNPSTATSTAVLRYEDAYFDILLQDVAGSFTGGGPAISTPVSRLLAHDDEHHTDFAQSLVVYLREFGSVHDAARALHVHANTLRYRLRRLSDLCGIDLADHDARFKAMLELRIRGLLG
ncbi:helix-turn-helix domain-containing protein [Actinosynnema sp. NPDC020468]|uniref:PucR family transcriptional regulator n=1 Tax=Actinosynnema sp. NPDC020468 TaxID=3154488 RepID=UPI00340A7B00